jgi:3-hydroxy-9,10-secoandrosta-1,3,5(10)-triene-9,17-dione monooxygenase reductase component
MTVTADRPALTVPDHVRATQDFRRVLGHLPTGVVVVSARTADGPIGMAVNSITSVSLEPRLVSICAARSSSTWPQLRRAGRFCISILADHHESASRQFATPGVDRFAGLTWHDRPGGPALDDAVAWLDCELYAEYAAGDHTIAVVSVTDLDAVDDRRALVFFRGRYGQFVPNNQA